MELVAGQVVEMVGELEPGWWKGLIGGRVFPSKFVSGPFSEAELVNSSVKSPPSLQAHPTRSCKHGPLIATRDRARILAQGLFYLIFQ